MRNNNGFNDEGDISEEELADNLILHATPGSPLYDEEFHRQMYEHDPNGFDGTLGEHGYRLYAPGTTMIHADMIHMVCVCLGKEATRGNVDFGKAV